jgi:hypothetical protein
MPPEPTAVEPLLVAKPWLLCSMSRAHWCRLEVTGKTPAAIRLGRKKLYRRAELIAWTEAGCPPRVEWETRKAQSRRYSHVMN